MSREGEFGSRFRLSLFDRLIPRDDGRSQLSAAGRLSFLQETVRRDLEFLLNTRRCCLTPTLASSETLRRSLLFYGIPDPSGRFLNSDDQKSEFKAAVGEAIKLFEPRLKVKSIELDSRREDRSIHFRIKATLHVELSSPVQMTFESHYDPSESRFKLEYRGQ